MRVDGSSILIKYQLPEVFLPMISFVVPLVISRKIGAAVLSPPLQWESTSRTNVAGTADGTGVFVAGREVLEGKLVKVGVLSALVGLGVDVGVDDGVFVWVGVVVRVAVSVGLICVSVAVGVSVGGGIIIIP